MKRPLIQYLADLYYKDLDALHFVMMWIYLVAGFGMVCTNGSSPSGDLKFLVDRAHPVMWGILFWIVAAWSGVLLWKCVKHTITNIVIGALGIWLWALLFISSALLTPLESMSPLYLVCVAIEFWRTARALEEHMKEAHDGA